MGNVACNLLAHLKLQSKTGFTQRAIPEATDEQSCYV